MNIKKKKAIWEVKILYTFAKFSLFYIQFFNIILFITKYIQFWKRCINIIVYTL